MTAPAFGSNGVGDSKAPCPLANLKVTVKQRADQKAASCGLKVIVSGAKMMEGPLAQGIKELEFQHLPPGQYTIRIEADQPFIDHYEVPDPVSVKLEKSSTQSAEVLIDGFARVEVIVKRQDGKGIEGEVTVALRRDKMGDSTPAADQVETTNLKAVFPRVRSSLYTVTVAAIPGALDRRYAKPYPTVSLGVQANQSPAKAELVLTPLPWTILKAVSTSGAKVDAIGAKVKDPGGSVADAAAAAAFVEINATTAGDGGFQVESVGINPGEPDLPWECVELDSKG